MRRRRKRIPFWQKALSITLLIVLFIIILPSTIKTLKTSIESREIRKEKEAYIQSTKNREIKQVDEIIKVGLERIDLRGVREVVNEDAIYSPETDTPRIFKE